MLNNEINKKVKEILTEYGLDFKIEKLPLVAKQPIVSIGEGGKVITDFVDVPTEDFGLFNDKLGKVIHTVKKGYTVSQNDEVVELVLRGMQGYGNLTVQKGGALNEGRKVFLQLGIDGTTKVGDDTIKKYVTIVDSNDGSTGLSVGIGDFTMSCSNQFFKFYKAGQSKMRHTASLTAKLEEIPYLIDTALEESMRQTELYQKLTTVKVGVNDVDNLVELLVGFNKNSDLSEKTAKSLNPMNKLYEMIQVEMNQKGKNMWGLHSGVTRWTTHEKSAPRRDNGRIESLMMGTNYKVNQKSLEFVSELAGV